MSAPYGTETTYLVDFDEDGLEWWLCVGEVDFGPYETEDEARQDGDLLMLRRTVTFG